MPRAGYVRVKLSAAEAAAIAEFLRNPDHWKPQLHPETSLVILAPPDIRRARCMQLSQKLQHFSGQACRQSDGIQLKREDAAWIGAWSATINRGDWGSLLSRFSRSARGHRGRPKLTLEEARVIARKGTRSDREVQRVKRHLQQYDLPIDQLLRLTNLTIFRRS